MRPGVAIAQTYTGSEDFPGGDVVTMSPGGPGRMIECMKCDTCGHSVSSTAKEPEPAAADLHARQITYLQAQAHVLRQALERIERWFGEFPETDRFWDDEKTQPMTYGAAFGANGERDYMRSVARHALTQAYLPGP